MPGQCCVVGCSNTRPKDLKSGKTRRYFKIPTVRKNEGDDLRQTLELRRRQWISQINRKDITEQTVKAHHMVCSDHFIKEEPAYEMFVNDPDWIPTLKLGHACVQKPSARVRELLGNLEQHKASVRDPEKLQSALPGSSAPNRSVEHRKDTTLQKNNKVLTVDTEKKLTDASKETASRKNKTSVVNIKQRSVDYNEENSVTATSSEPSHGNRQESAVPTNNQVLLDANSKTFLPVPAEEIPVQHPTVNPPSGPLFECDVCMLLLESVSALLRHRKRHFEPKPFMCKVCSKQFATAFYLKTHAITHTEERPFKCRHCNKSFKRKRPLNAHIRSLHTNDRPYICGVCGKAFAHSKNFNLHTMVHTGKKPYLCARCGKHFPTLGKLRIHDLSHSGEKPHACPHCPAAFKSSQYLKIHIRRNHQEKCATATHTE